MSPYGNNEFREIVTKRYKVISRTSTDKNLNGFPQIHLVNKCLDLDI